jgi:hypothetical protein
MEAEIIGDVQRWRKPRLYPGITQELAANESQRGRNVTRQKALIYEACFRCGVYGERTGALAKILFSPDALFRTAPGIGSPRPVGCAKL